MKLHFEEFACREQTYKSNDAARRSFYKWVCKQKLFGPMQIIRVGKWIHHERGPEDYNYGYPWARGYPSFDASRSEARKCWNNKFLEWKNGWLDRAVERRIEQSRANARADLMERLKDSKFFALSAGASAISCEPTRQK